VVFHLAYKTSCAYLELTLCRQVNINMFRNGFCCFYGTAMSGYLYMYDCFQNFIVNAVYEFQVLASENVASCEVTLLVSKVLLDVW
jgi:hypothetical protein